MKARNVPLLNTRNLIERARRAFAQKDYESTAEILSQLESEGGHGQDVVQLRRDLEEARRNESAYLSLHAARHFFDQDEYSLALGKLDETLKIQPKHGAALALKEEIENKVAARKMAGLLEVAAARLSESSFTSARQITQEALQLRPEDPEALLLLSQIDKQEKDLFHPDDPQPESQAGEVLSEEDEHQSAYRDSITQSVRDEPDLEKQTEILELAMDGRPPDPFLEREGQRIEERKHVVAELVQQARELEEGGSFHEAVNNWLRVREIYPTFPSLREHIDHARAQWIQQRSLAKTALLESTRAAVAQGDHAAAGKFLLEADDEFPNDAEFRSLSRRRLKQVEKFVKVQTLLHQSQSALNDQQTAKALDDYRAALELSGDFDSLRSLAFATVLEDAAKITPTNWPAAESLLNIAAAIRPPLTIPATHWEAVRHAQREEQICSALRYCAEQNPDGDLEACRVKLNEALERFPAEPRLQSCLSSIELALVEQGVRREREACLSELYGLQHYVENINEATEVWDLQTRCKRIAAPYPDDREITKVADTLGEQLATYVKASTLFMNGRPKECIPICTKMLAERPNYRIFRNLRDAAEKRLQELASEHLERVERWLAAAPDLESRRQILEKALVEYPGDSAFTSELDVVRGKIALVAGIVEKAKSFEQRKLFADAELEWTHLQSVYPEYPGVEAAIARATALQDWYLRKEQAEYLLDQACRFFENGQFSEGNDQIRETVSVAPDHVDIVKSCARTLVHYSREAFRTDPAMANSMVDLAQTVDPEVELPREPRGGFLGLFERNRQPAPRKPRSDR